MQNTYPINNARNRFPSIDIDRNLSFRETIQLEKNINNNPEPAYYVVGDNLTLGFRVSSNLESNIPDTYSIILQVCPNWSLGSAARSLVCLGAPAPSGYFSYGSNNSDGTVQVSYLNSAGTLFSATVGNLADLKGVWTTLVFVRISGVWSAYKDGVLLNWGTPPYDSSKPIAFLGFGGNGSIFAESFLGWVSSIHIEVSTNISEIEDHIKGVTNDLSLSNMDFTPDGGCDSCWVSKSGDFVLLPELGSVSILLNKKSISKLLTFSISIALPGLDSGGFNQVDVPLTIPDFAPENSFYSVNLLANLPNGIVLNYVKTITPYQVILNFSSTESSPQLVNSFPIQILVTY